LTTSELQLKLDSFGGYNKRYQAITSKDTENFPILLNQPAAVKWPVYKVTSIYLLKSCSVARDRPTLSHKQISQVSQNEALSTKLATIACAPSGQRSPRCHPIISRAI